MFCVLLVTIVAGGSASQALPERALAQAHPPWDITVYPDTVYISPPHCSASFVAHVTADYKDKPISILLDERKEGDWTGPFSLISGVLYDGTPRIPSKLPDYDTVVTILVVSPWEKPAGTYRVRVYAYPTDEDPYEYEVYAILKVVIVDTGIESCDPGWTPPPPPKTPTPPTTPPPPPPPYDWWDWWRWWYWWEWRWPWTLQQPFDFSIEATPNSQSIKAGQSAAFTVNVKLISGAAQPVALSLSGLPAGATHSFSLASGTPTYTSALEISTESSMPADTFTLTITGTGGGKVHSTTINLGVDVSKTTSSISLSVNPTSVAIGEPVSTAGALSPGLAGAIDLIYQRPDGFEMTKHVTASTSGAFSDTFKPEMDGLWTVKARWAGDKDRFGCESVSASISVTAPENPWPLLGMIVVIAAAIGAAALIFSKRGKRVAGKTVTKPEASYCLKCGAQIPEGATFCQKCGQRIP